MIALLRRLWHGTPAWVQARVDVGGWWANATTREDEQMWLYDNRERAHMETCPTCNPKVVVQACPYHGGKSFDGTCGWCG